MKLAFLTVEERLYLPRFFQRFLAKAEHETVGIFKVPMKHGRQSTLGMINKYRKAFGFINLIKLAHREANAWIGDFSSFKGKPGGYASIASIADTFNIPCEKVADVNASEFHGHLKAIGAEVLISVSCPQIFNRELIDLPCKGCINVHGSILPNYRGLAPSFWMLKNGESVAGVTVFYMNEGLDAGAIIESEKFPIYPNESLEAFIIRSKEKSCDVLIRALDHIVEGDVKPIQIDVNKGSYYGFPSRKDYREFLRAGRRLWE